MLLTIVDRDGTLIELVPYLGRENTWKDQVKLNPPVIALLRYIQDTYPAKTFVITNQAGVARKYFNYKRVEEINNYVEQRLNDFGIRIDGWNYCPDVDSNYVAVNSHIEFDKKFIKKQTNRKPSINMVSEILKSENLNLSNFEKILVLGDTEDDKNLAENLKGSYIDVKEKDYKQLKEEFLSFF